MRRISFTWTGNSSNPDYWNESTNWSSLGGGYPNTSSDDATIGGCGFTVYFDASRTIDDLNLTVSGDTCGAVDFDAETHDYTLTCDTVMLGTYAIDGVRMVNRAGIITN